MKESVQIFLKLISTIALYLFIDSIACGSRLVTLSLYLTGVVVMSYLLVRERPQECLQNTLHIALPLAGLMSTAGSLPDAHFSLALIYIVSTGTVFLSEVLITTVSRTYQKVGLPALTSLLVVAVRLLFSVKFQYLVGVR